MSNQTLPLSESKPNSLIVDKNRFINDYKVYNHLEQNKPLSKKLKYMTLSEILIGYINLQHFKND